MTRKRVGNLVYNTGASGAVTPINSEQVGLNQRCLLRFKANNNTVEERGIRGTDCLLSGLLHEGRPQEQWPLYGYDCQHLNWLGSSIFQPVSGAFL